MENLIYGFEMNLINYDLKDILLWMLVMSTLYMITGRYIEKRKISNSYFKLIRFGRIQKLWHKVCMSVLLLSLVLVLLLFSTVVLYQYIFAAETFDKMILSKITQAFFIFIINFFTMNMVQSLLINLTNGEKISFMVIMLIEILSLYFGIVSERVGYWLPGSFMMYARSSFFTEMGYNVTVSMTIQLVFDIILFFGGYKIIMRRK